MARQAAASSPHAEVPSSANARHHGDEQAEATQPGPSPEGNLSSNGASSSPRGSASDKPPPAGEDPSFEDASLSEGLEHNGDNKSFHDAFHWTASTTTGGWHRTATLIATDVLALLASVACGTLLTALLVRGIAAPLLLSVGGAAVTLAALCYAASGLYAGILPPPADESRTLGLATLGAFGGVSLTAGPLLGGNVPALLALALSCAVAMPLVLIGRAFLRYACAHRPWWQRPVVVLGAGPVGCRVVRTLVGQPGRGLRPVAMVDEDPNRHGGSVEGVPVVGGLAEATYYSQQGVPYAITEVPPTEDRERARAIEFCTSGFKSVLFTSGDFSELPMRWARAQSIGGMVGLELQRRQRSPWRRYLKRAFDVVVSAGLLAVALPVCLLAALLIKLDSKGAVFYRQERLGSGGRRFEVIKFRSMYLGAEERLQKLLDNDPEARTEFERYQKLSDDPRVTRAGRVLRKTSLDELPQLWNVLKGEMSLVGPRAYLPEELSKMKRLDNLILRSKPGLTGLWQVSGRNELSFEARVDLEASYVRNWSLFFDIYLLIRTVPVVILGRGAQ